MTNSKNSQLSKFYKRTIDERREAIRQWVGSDVDVDKLLTENLTHLQADSMVENVIGTYALPLGIATNFQINGRDYLIPMVVEEPSVIAAASNAAKMFRAGGGFYTSSEDIAPLRKSHSTIRLNPIVTYPPAFSQA